MAENWFTKPGFWEHLGSFFPGKTLGGRFGYFLFFSRSGAGERGRRPRRRPGAGLNKKQRGGVFRGGGAGGGRVPVECL